MAARRSKTSLSRASAVAAIISVIAGAVGHNHCTVHAFVPPTPFSPKHVARRLQTPPITTQAARPTSPNLREFRSRNILRVTATASSEDLEKEISAMRVKEIRQELDSYGVSTKSFFEKSELVQALVKAREEGMTPIDGGVDGDVETASSASSSSSSTSSSSDGSTASRQENIKQEMEKCSKMKVGELKKELESYGMSTKSYFEKSEFVRAVAEVRVDGPPKEPAASGSSGTGSRGRVRDEPRDPSYRDVVVSKFQGNKDLLAIEGKLIDVKAR